MDVPPPPPAPVRPRATKGVGGGGVLGVVWAESESSNRGHNDFLGLP